METSGGQRHPLSRRKIHPFHPPHSYHVPRQDTLVELHPSPRVWCGGIATRQEATFEVQAVLAGEGQPAEVRVAFLLVRGSRPPVLESWLVLSLGIGFGLQNVVANYVAGLVIFFERPVKEGDRILFSKYAGTDIKIDGEEHIFMREDDILGIIS